MSTSSHDDDGDHRGAKTISDMRSRQLQRLQGGQGGLYLGPVRRRWLCCGVAAYGRHRAGLETPSGQQIKSNHAVSSSGLECLFINERTLSFSQTLLFNEGKKRKKFHIRNV